MKLKILMTEFDSLAPLGCNGPDATRERTLVRDVMEVAVFLSAREGDEAAFQRHMAQVRAVVEMSGGRGCPMRCSGGY